MAEWWCGRPKWFVFSDVKSDHAPSYQVKMHSSVTLILIFLSGMTVAFLGTLFPNISWPSLLGFEAKSPPTLGTAMVKNIRFRAYLDPERTSLQPVKAAPVGVAEVQGEALSAFNIAKEMKDQGKHEKATRLFKHAIALAPEHADLLNEYGEYLESHHKDVVQAEAMYKKALIVCPSHNKALVNRKRTLPLVEEIDQVRFNRIERKRDMLFKIPENHAGLRRAKKENYFRHIYHTNAIEGNTMTLAQTRAIVENRLAIGGKSIMEHNEVLGLDAALSYVNSTLVQRIGRITKQDILEIHKRVLGFVDPVEAGKYRNTQVFVGDFTPPAADEIEDLMADFILWLNSDEALNLHPIEYAALAHYNLVIIHPFYDGNGRTSRLLMNLILMQAGYPPIIIKVEEKFKYYEYIETANHGDVRPFIRFIAKCTENSVDEFLMASVERPKSLQPLFSKTDDGRTIIMDEDDIQP